MGKFAGPRDTILARGQGCRGSGSPEYSPHMSAGPDVPDPDRFRPHAVRELSGMFDDVSGRYDLLNRIMSLGQDRAWRVAMYVRMVASSSSNRVVSRS